MIATLATSQNWSKKDWQEVGTQVFSFFFLENFAHSDQKTTRANDFHKAFSGKKNPPKSSHFQGKKCHEFTMFRLQLLESRQQIMGFHKQKNTTCHSDLQPDLAKSSFGGSPVHQPHEIGGKTKPPGWNMAKWKISFEIGVFNSIFTWVSATFTWVWNLHDWCCHGESGQNMLKVF